MFNHIRVRRLLAMVLLASTTALAAVTMLSIEPAAAQSGPKWKQAANNSAVVRVSSGESIQDALDAAKSGTTIVVEAGVYREQVRIRKNGITLRGLKGAIIRPLTAQTTTDCDFNGFGAAICVGSEFLPAQNPGLIPGLTHPETRLRNITITGFTIEAPTGSGIWVANARHVVVARNVIKDATAIGIDFENVQRFWIARNRVTRPDGGLFPSAFIGGLGTSDGRFVDNTLQGGPLDGLLMFRAKRIRVHNNTITGQCSGMTLMEGFTEPGRGGPSRVTISKNRIRNNDRSCPGVSPGEIFGGWGIRLFGGTDLVLKKNTIVDHQPEEASTARGAVFAFPLTPIERLTVVDNTLDRNIYQGVRRDLSLVVDEAELTVARNTCALSAPNTDWCSGG